MILDTKPVGYYNGQRHEMMDFVPIDARTVLEVGCGSGAFGKTLKTRQIAEVWGIEISQEAAREAAKQLDKVIIGNIENDSIDLPKRYFDCVIFNDVIEHLTNPWSVLKNLRHNLSDSGCLVASIPNVRFFRTIKALLLNNEWKYVDAGVLDKTHLRFFTQKSIGNLFETSGYELVKIQGINGIEFPWKFKIFNWLSGKRFEDMRYLQFACVGKKFVN